MNPFAARENARTLSAAIGINEEDAGELLNFSVAVTFPTGVQMAAAFSQHLTAILGRTIRHVAVNDPDLCAGCSLEVVIGNAEPRYVVRRIFVQIGDEAVMVGLHPGPVRAGNVHPVGLILGACYTTAAVLKLALDNRIPYPMPGQLVIDLHELLGPDLSLLYNTASFDEAYLAGAGAVGSGFLYALARFDVVGDLHVVDDDRVSAGNLQRSLLFSDAHLNRSKAEVVCEETRRFLPGVNFIPHCRRLQDLPNRKGAWLAKLIVGVDSPRARRQLQMEFPGEVFDASTTGIQEVVLHFHRQPTDGACLACIYPSTPEENAHARHVAEALGVSVADVEQLKISEAAAQAICRQHQQLNANELVGIAYDTLFKQLCATASLKAAEDKQVLAPFAFVSMLAGAFLAIEFVRRLHKPALNLFNEWRVSPWSPPVLRRRRRLDKHPDCECCSSPILGPLALELWGRRAST